MWGRRPRGLAKPVPTYSLVAAGCCRPASSDARDHDVIDWLRPTTADRWQTYNVRDVTTLGFEVGVQKALSSSSFVHLQYTAIDVDAATVDQLSKYVLDYAPHSLTAAASDSVAGGFPRVATNRIPEAIAHDRHLRLCRARRARRPSDWP